MSAELAVAAPESLLRMIKTCHIKKCSRPWLCGVKVKVDATGPVRCTLLVVRDGIDSGATSGVSRLSSVTNPVDPNTRRPRSPRSWLYRLGCVAAQAETAGEQKSRLSTRGALESVTGLVHVIRTASMPSAKSRFRSCEQRCFGPPAFA